MHRDLSGRFGDESYAAEELVAELGAAYLSTTLSIPGKLQHAEYIGHWITLLQHDSRAIFTAASKGAEAARFLEEKGDLEWKERKLKKPGKIDREKGVPVFNETPAFSVRQVRGKEHPPIPLLLAGEGGRTSVANHGPESQPLMGAGLAR